MTRVLLSFGAWAGGMSGGDRHILEMAARWRDRVEIEVLAPPEAAAMISPFLPGVPLIPLGRLSPRTSAGGPLLAAEYVRRALSSLRTVRRHDVVVASSHFLPDAAAVTAGVRRGALGVGYVYHLIADRVDRSPRSLWSKFDERVSLALLKRHAGVIFACNGRTADDLSRRGLTPVRTEVGLDVGSFPSAAAAHAPPVVVFVARLVATKGLRDAIEAFAQVRTGVPEAHLIVVGSGPERAAGERLAKQLGIADSVQWAGFVSEEDKRQLMAGARAFLAPSYEEGWGISVAEAMATGLPVVAYRLPILDEVYGDAYAGVALGSVSALAQSLTRFLLDDRAAAHAARSGRERVSRYHVDRIAAQELEIILGELTAHSNARAMAHG